MTTNVNVLVRYESELAAYETSLTETVAQVKSHAIKELLIPEGDGEGLVLAYQGRPLEDGGESLLQVLKGAAEERIEFRLEFRLIVNAAEKIWSKKRITGAEILVLAGSPSDWVVNQLVPGPGEDPEIGPHQHVDLAFGSEPRGVKKFKTRKPHTSPGQ
jgi:Multiubiquitin